MNGITRNRISEYTYNPFSTNRFPHLLKTAASPNNFSGGVKTTYGYEITAVGVPMVNAIAMPEAVNNSFVYEYDQEGRVKKVDFTDGK